MREGLIMSRVSILAACVSLVALSACSGGPVASVAPPNIASAVRAGRLSIVRALVQRLRPLSIC